MHIADVALVSSLRSARMDVLLTRVGAVEQRLIRIIAAMPLPYRAVDSLTRLHAVCYASIINALLAPAPSVQHMALYV